MEKAIKVNCTGTDFVDIDSLKEFQEDIKSLTPENKQKLKDSILKHGIIAPFFIWKKNRRKNILDGHQRLTVLKDMRESGHLIPEVPVIYVQAKTEEEAKEKLLQITSQYGDFEKKQVEIFMSELNIEISDIRLVNKPLILKSVEKIEKEIVAVKEITKSGDIWELNNHKVYCVDSDKNIDVIKEIDKYMIITDPPFEKKDFAWFDLLNKKNPIFIMHSDSGMVDLIHKYKDIFKYFLVHYYSFGFARSKNMPQLAHHLIAVMGEQKFKSADGFKTVICEQMERNRLMPYQKRTEIFQEIIDHYGENRDIIYDPFLGSGTMIIVAEKVNKICYGNEIDPKNCDIIVNRYYNYLLSEGKSATFKLNGKLFDHNIFKPE